MNEDGDSGGCGMWFDENLFEKPVELEVRLKARRVEVKDEIEGLTAGVSRLKRELAKIEYALSQ